MSVAPASGTTASVTQAPHPAPDELPMTPARWLAAIGVALFFLALVALAVRHVELVTGRYVTTGSPPVPAVAGLLALVAARALLLRLPPRWRFLAPDRRQMLLVFVMLCLGVGLNGQYVVRAFLPHLVSLQYWQSHNNTALARWSGYLPEWYAPADVEALAPFFEGSRGTGSGVPWLLWLTPLLRWSLFFVALYVVGAALMALLRRQWLQHERLSFPLLWLPLNLTAADTTATFGKPLQRHPLLWLGVGVAAIFNGLNIGHALNPVIPGPGFYYSFSGQFPDAPLTPLNTLMLFFMLEAIGFGYFLPLEVSFSAWFLYAAEKALAIAGLAAGYEAPNFPYLQDQSAGAYLGVAGLLLFGARHHLAGIARRSLGLSGSVGTEEQREERTAFFLFLGGLAFLLAWAWVSGFSLMVAAPFFAVLLCFILVYARMKAETGVPFSFIYPYDLPKEMVVNAFTPRGILDTGGPRTWVVFSSMAWLSRHHYAQEAATYTLDSMKLADESRTARRWFYGALLLTLVVGLAMAFWSHLEAYYSIGSSMAGGGRSEYRATVALEEYRRMANQATSNAPRDLARLGAQMGGCGFAVALGILRTVWVKSPFHPLGYILATAYGNHTTIFFPMLMAWICKSLALRGGGLPLYRRFIPFFLGLIIGHYVIGGVFWPLFSLTLAPEARASYHIYFGG